MRNKKFLAALLVGVAVVGSIAVYKFYRSGTENAQNEAAQNTVNDKTPLGQVAKTVQDLQNRLKSDANNADLLTQLGSALLKKAALEYKGKEQAAVARTYLEKAVSIAPANVNALLALGYSYELEGNLDKADENYQKAQTADGSNSDVFTALGRIASQKEDYANAGTLFGKAIALNGNNTGAYYAAGRTFETIGDADHAFSSYANVLKLSSDNTEKSLAFVGEARIIAGSDNRASNKNESSDDINSALALNPGNAEAYAERVREFFYRLTDADEADNFDSNLQNATDAFNAAVKLNPNQSEAYEWETLVLASASNYETATTVANSGVKVASDDLSITQSDRTSVLARLYLYKSFLYAQYPENTGNIDASAKYMKMALDLRSDLKKIVSAQLAKKDGGMLSRVKNEKTILAVISQTK